MSTMTKKNFRPTPDLIRAAENLLVTMAFEAHVRPIVEGYETAILREKQFRTADKWAEHLEPRTITDRKDSFLMGDDDAKVYYAACFAARDAAGLKVENPEHCPLLVAEGDRMRAESAFIEALGEIQGLESFSLKPHVLTLDQRAKVIKLGLGLLAPFVADADTVLKRILGADPAPQAA